MKFPMEFEEFPKQSSKEFLKESFNPCYVFVRIFYSGYLKGPWEQSLERFLTIFFSEEIVVDLPEAIFGEILERIVWGIPHRFAEGTCYEFFLRNPWWNLYRDSEGGNFGSIPS